MQAGEEISYSGSEESSDGEEEDEENGGGISDMVGSAGWYEDVSLDALDCREALNRHVFKARIKRALSKDRVSDYNKTRLFQTYLGIMHVNAFLAYRYEQGINVS